MSLLFLVNGVSQSRHKLCKQILCAENIVAKPKDQHHYYLIILFMIIIILWLLIKCLIRINNACLLHVRTIQSWPISFLFRIQICTLSFLITPFYNQMGLALSTQPSFSHGFWEVDKVGNHGEKPCATSHRLNSASPTALEVRHLQEDHDPNSG